MFELFYFGGVIVCLYVGCVVVLHNLVPFRPGLERVKRWTSLWEKHWYKSRKIRLGFQSVRESSVIRKALDRETLKITCFRNTFRPRQMRRYDRVSVVREIPAGRWGGADDQRRGHTDSTLGSESRRRREETREASRDVASGTGAGRVCASGSR